MPYKDKNMRKKYLKKYYEKNRERCNLLKKEYKKRNKGTYAKLQREYRKRYPEKILAHTLSKKIKIPEKKLCEGCESNLAKEKHHQNYNKPLEITFLCKSCHTKIHRGKI